MMDMDLILCLYICDQECQAQKPVSSLVDSLTSRRLVNPPTAGSTDS